jgi:hypothetical protein
MSNISKRVSKEEEGWYIKVPITFCPGEERRRQSVGVFGQRASWKRRERMWSNTRDF